VTAAAVVIPKAMAYATIAQLPVQVGLYTACVPMAIYAMLGTSRPLSVSTTTTLAILSAAAFGDVSFGSGGVTLQANASLTVLVGAILIAASLLRLGFVANFISEPVLVGFKAGIAIVILADQIPKILGIHIARGSVRRQRERGMSVWLVGLNPAVRSVIEPSPLGEMLGREGLHFNVEVAVANYLQRAA